MLDKVERYTIIKTLGSRSMHTFGFYDVSAWRKRLTVNLIADTGGVLLKRFS